MSLADRESTLQRYFDGELPAAETIALRAELEADEELRAKLDGLEHLRTLLRAAFAPESMSVDADALFADVESGIGEDRSEGSEGEESEGEESEGEPSEGELAPSAVPPVPPVAVPDAEQRSRLRVVEGGRDPAEKKRLDRTWLGIIGGTLAAAAAIIVIFVLPRDPDPETPRDPIADNVAPEPGSEIEDVDFGYSTGAIFQVEGNEGAQYAVIWISDEKVEYTIEVPDDAEERIQ